MVKRMKYVWRIVYGKDKPYYKLNGKKVYVKNKSAIQQMGQRRQIKVLTTNLSAREM